MLRMAPVGVFVARVRYVQAVEARGPREDDDLIADAQDLQDVLLPAVELGCRSVVGRPDDGQVWVVGGPPEPLAALDDEVSVDVVEGACVDRLAWDRIERVEAVGSGGTNVCSPWCRSSTVDSRSLPSSRRTP